MKIGIISDIHSNLESFKTSLNYLKKNKIDKLIIIGDIIGYGPDPKECIELANNNADIILKGNHEEGILKNDFSRFKQYAKISLEWTAKELKEKIDEIKKWENKKEMEDIIFVHASISDIFYKYILKIKDAEEEFKIFDKKICFVGHTHIPGGFKKNIENGKIEKIMTDFSGKMELKIEKSFIYIINVGSAGLPRDGLPFLCISIYDTDKKIFKLDRIEYDIEVTLKKIIEKGLPSKICSFLKGF
ncbi:MAG: metallophosphatase family protein [Candidatus Omnitrophica bacterium]|nr:metallophosphatase family protein [Candidatus Omnitrophota bacterium]